MPRKRGRKTAAPPGTAPKVARRDKPYVYIERKERERCEEAVATEEEAVAADKAAAVFQQAALVEERADLAVQKAAFAEAKAAIAQDKANIKARVTAIERIEALQIGPQRILLRKQGLADGLVKIATRLQLPKLVKISGQGRVRAHEFEKKTALNTRGTDEVQCEMWGIRGRCSTTNSASNWTAISPACMRRGSKSSGVQLEGGSRTSMAGKCQTARCGACCTGLGTGAGGQGSKSFPRTRPGKHVSVAFSLR